MVGTDGGGFTLGVPGVWKSVFATTATYSKGKLTWLGLACGMSQGSCMPLNCVRIE